MTMQIEETEVTDFTAIEVLRAIAAAVIEGDVFDSAEYGIDLDDLSLDDSLSELDFYWGEYTTYVPEGYINDEGFRQHFKPMELELNGQRYPVIEVEHTGGMDEGSNASSTIKVGSQFFRKSGYYASHYGHDWDGDFEEVFAKEKTVIVYSTHV